MPAPSHTFGCCWCWWLLTAWWCSYVAFFFKGMAQFLHRQGLAKSIGKVRNAFHHTATPPVSTSHSLTRSLLLQAIAITEKHDAWISEYNEGATETAAWIAEATGTYSVTEHGTTAAEVKATLEAFSQYKAEVKPAWKAKLTGLEGLFNTFMSSCRNNGRPEYVPEDGLKLQELDAGWEVHCCCCCPLLAPPCPCLRSLSHTHTVAVVMEHRH